MKRKNVGISLAAAGLLAGAFLAGGLLFGGGDSAATSGNTGGVTTGIVTPTATATKSPTVAPKVTTVAPSPVVGATATPVQGGGNLNPVGGTEGGSGSGNGTGNGGGTQPPAPVAPTVAPVAPTAEPPAPVVPTAVPTLVVPTLVVPTLVVPTLVVPTAVPPTPVPPTVEPTGVVNVAPVVTGSTPADDETGVHLDTSISVTFETAMEPASVEAAFTISPNVSGSFEWSDGDTVLTFTPDAPFSYNTKVEWAVAENATDQSGLAMAADFSSSFMVLRQKTINLYSQPARDGFVYAPSVDTLQPVVTAGFNGHNSLLVGSWKRGFLSFDLSQLPATTVDITAAELSIHQRAHHASAYTAETGALWIVDMPYVDLDAGDYSTPTPTICPNICYPLGMELSSSAADGWKYADLTVLVRADWNASKGDITSEVQAGTNERLSQFRLQFLNENKGAGPDVWAEFHSGEAGGSAPKLQVTYVYR